MSQLIFDNLVVDVVRKAIKNLHLRIFPSEGRVRVTVPFFVSETLIRRRLAHKMPWIKRKLAQFADTPRPLPQMMVSGETHYFLGKPFTLQLVEHPSLRPTVLRDEAQINLYARPASDINERKKTLDLWYRKEFHALLPPLLEKWEPIVGVKTARCTIKKMSTRWGSCSIQSRRISLNLELVKKPLECLEYVLVHELVHLHERLHNKRFWALMDQFMPSWRNHREILNSNQPHKSCD